ncbi:MAG: hypothetical protein HF973_07650 [Chloroflexi bacterium]|nr:hypothetical protein [Chloroflexota bacterium]
MADPRQIRIDVITRLLEDEAYFAWFLRDPDAALAEYPDLDPRDGRLIKREVTDRASLENLARRFKVPIRSAPSESLISPSRGDSVKGDKVKMEEVGPEADEEPPQRIVSTGFSAADIPGQPLSSDTPLLPNQSYYFWLEVGEPIAGSIEVTPTALPDDLPPKARLQVVLYDFKAGIEQIRPDDVGEIELQENGTVKVIKPVAIPDGLDDPELVERRLFFPLRTSPQNGRYQLRCNIYYQQNLLQSRLITFYVQEWPRRMPNALISELDYVLSRTFDGRTLSGMGQTRLSVMLNDNGNGTHGFRFFGENQFKNDAELGEGELTNLIEMARGALRKAAWGDEKPYQAGKTYRYNNPDADRLRADLITFALRGYRFYDALINRLAGDADKAWELADLMLKPGQVQIASKQSARLVIPAALMYDYPLDDGRPSSQYTLCDTFQKALQDGDPLAETECFQGNCPSYDQDTVICPSGFWGFRHSLGLPVSLDEAPDAPSEIPVDGDVTLGISVSTDPDLTLRPVHEQRLQAMGFEWEYADSRDGSLEMLKQIEPELVYFYCHGGLQNDMPYLSLGKPGSERFTRASLRNKRIRWRKVRPLVFINGCHTTQLTPERALDLVTAFVATAHAAGVVGTEISIFEPIAVTFAEECFRRFLIEKETIGDAIRGARLKMLQEGNPLGLVYIPYALPGLHLA